MRGGGGWRVWDGGLTWSLLSNDVYARACGGGFSTVFEIKCYLKLTIYLKILVFISKQIENNDAFNLL